MDDDSNKPRWVWDSGSDQLRRRRPSDDEPSTDGGCILFLAIVGTLIVFFVL